MNINHLPTGQPLRVLPSFSDNWMNGVVTEAEGVIDKFVQLDNGEEVFDFEIEELKILER